MGAVAHGECQVCGSRAPVELAARVRELEHALRDAQSLLQQAANRARIDGDAFRDAALAAYRVLDPKRT